MGELRVGELRVGELRVGELRVGELDDSRDWIIKKIYIKKIVANRKVSFDKKHLLFGRKSSFHLFFLILFNFIS